MEFLRTNMINTITQLNVTSNTSTAINLFNPDTTYQYYTDGLANDLTSASITITFDTAKSISRIGLKSFNLKEFNMFYNGVTANAFSFTSGPTTTSYFTSNTEENLYLRFNTISASSITLDMKKTIVANEEKQIGYMFISELLFSPTVLPSANSYKPKIKTKQIVHKMSDGGTRIHNIKRKWETVFSVDYITQSERDAYESIYNLNDSFIFTPFGTSTAWDAIAYEGVWPGDFNFYEYSDNASSSGFSGNISIMETSI